MYIDPVWSEQYLGVLPVCTAQRNRVLKHTVVNLMECHVSDAVNKKNFLCFKKSPFIFVNFQTKNQTSYEV